MRRLKFIKVVVPEIVAYLVFSGGEMEPDYRCPECGCGVADEYVACPYCAAELDWNHVKIPSEKFIKLVNRL